MESVQLLKLAIFCLMFSLVLSEDYMIECYCGGNHVSMNCPKDNSCSEKNGKCYKVIQKLNGVLYIDHGCYNQEEANYPFNCRTGNNPNINIYCCNNGTWCNKNNFDVPIGLPPPNNPKTNDWSGALNLIIVAVVMAVLVLAAGLLLFVLLKKNPKSIFKSCIVPKKSPSSTKDNAELLPDIPDDTGSGFGEKLLMERTIARQIEIKEVIGRGKFGEVYRGVYNSSNVAVKKIQPRDQKSWQREKDIFETHMLRHANILGFIATDNKDNTIQTEFWIISDYHQYGSLYDYLEHAKVNKETLLKMLLSISSGLSHLHIEIPAGSEAKPPIAHRDLKSKNILVKNNLECAIADFGHAVRYLSKTNEMRDNEMRDNDDLIGTKRYMAPEVLNETINRHTFDAFSRADVYSLGLVFWEVARRSDINGQNRSYELPYFDMVPADPTPEIMRMVVCDQCKRPPFYSNWYMDQCLTGLTKIMEECWYENGAARLSALRIKKKLLDLHTISFSAEETQYYHSC